MVGIITVAAAGIFVIGVAVGIVLIVSYGIRREERRFQRIRRFQEEHGLWGRPGAQEHFLPEEAPDGMTWAARRLNGLHVRHRPAPVRRDAGLGTRA
jgi:hypothetical protein